MPEAEDIVQRIVLAGNSEVAEAFLAIQDAGVKAFEAIEHAAESSSLLGFVAGVAGVSAAVAGVAVGMFEWTRSASETINTMSELGAQAGTTIGDISSLVSVLTRAGGDTDNMAGAFRRASVTINMSWNEIKKAARDSADNLKSDYLAIETAAIALARAQETQRIQYKAASDLEINNANSIKEAQLNLRDAYEKLNVAQGHRPRSQSEEREVQVQRALLAVSEARQKLDEQQRKAEQDKIDAENKAAEAAIAAETAQLNLNAARKKAAEDAANDINNVTAAVNSLADGNSSALSKINASADNVVRGVINSVGQTSNALKGLSGSLSDLNSPAPQVKDVLLKLADVFHSTDDAALKTAVAVRFFGHAVSQDTIDALSEGSAAILEHQKHIRSLGLDYTDAEDKINRRFRESMAALTDDVRKVGDKFAIAFAPLFTDVISQLTEAIEHNKTTILSWGQTIASSVRPIISGFIASLTGFHLDSLSPDQFVKADQWRETFEKVEGYVRWFVDKVKEFFTVTIPVSANVIEKTLSGIATVFEKLTGIRLSPEQMGLTLLLGQITGINNVIFMLGGLVSGLGLIFLSASVPVAAFGVTANVSLGGIIIVLGLLAGAAYLVYNAFAKMSDKQFWDDMNTSTERTTARIMAMAGSLKAMWEWIKGNITFEQFKKFNEDIDSRIERDYPDPATKRAKGSAKSDQVTKESEESGGVFDTLKKLLTGTSDDAKKNLEAARDAVAHGASEGANALTGSASNLKDAASALFGAAGKLGGGSGGSAAERGGAPGIRTVGGSGGASDVPHRPTYGIRNAPGGGGGPAEGGISPAEARAKIAPDRSPNAPQPTLNGPEPAPDALYKRAKNYVDINGTERNPDGTVAVGAFLPGRSAPATGLNPDGSIGYGTDYDPNQPYNDPTGVRPRPGQGTYTGPDEGMGVFDAPNFNNGGVQYGYGPGARHDDVFSRTEYNDDHLRAQREKEDREREEEKKRRREEEEDDRAYARGGPVGDFLHYAGGGLVEGPGTGTSDSVPALIDGKHPAKLSSKEFVVRADGSNLGDAIRHFAKGFSLGGLVDVLSPSAPAFASGGPVGDGGVTGPMGHYTVDLRTDKGTFRVMASENTADKLSQHATNQRLTSTGNKPEWYR